MKRTLAAGAVLLACTTLSMASVIGQWNGSGYDSGGTTVVTWNYPAAGPSYSTTQIKSLMVAAGHTVAADADMTAVNLAGYDLFVIRNARLTPSGTELAALKSWVEGGGLLLMLTDSSTTTAPTNAILTGIGSSISGSGSVNQNAFLVGGTFLTSGLGDLALLTTVGQRITGGTALTKGSSSWTVSQQADAASYIHYEQLGTGYVVVFGDLSDCNYFEPTTTSVNGRLLLNAAAYSNPSRSSSGDPGPGDPAPSSTPVPPSLLLVITGVASTALYRRRRRK
jgi:hypothetical protein